MTRWSIAVVLVLAVGTIHAQSRPHDPETLDRAATTAGAANETTIRVRGTISTYDADGGILALSTPGGTVRFPVAADTRVRRGGKALDRRELKSFSGYRAAVRYSEADGRTTVESVNVFEKSERTPR